MKRRAITMIAIMALGIIGFTACNNGASDESTKTTTDTTTTTTTMDTTTTAAVQYTCPMHPEVVSDQPGDCPKCGMTLVEKTEANKSGADTSGKE